MSGLKTVITCPLGSKCEEIRDNVIHRCAWSIQLAGQNPQTGEVQDERGCAMAWMPLLLIENSKQQRGTTVAIESFRNETVQSNEASRAMMMAAATLPAMAKLAHAARTHKIDGNGEVVV